MTLTWPLSLPTGLQIPASAEMGADSVVGVSPSPFTKSQQVYAHQGQAWDISVDLPPMPRRRAAEWIGFLVALNGMEGTFTMKVPGYSQPRGTWAGASPVVKGAGQTGLTLTVDGLTSGMTALRADFLQLGSGSSTHLHMVVAPGTANGSGEVTLDIWPRLRSSPSDDATVVISNPLGLWRLAENRRSWSIQQAQRFGLSFRLIEATSD